MIIEKYGNNLKKNQKKKDKQEKPEPVRVKQVQVAKDLPKKKPNTKELIQSAKGPKKV